MTRRILTVVAPIRPAHSLKPEHIPCLVAVQPWRAPYPCLSVIVKATASFQGEGAHRKASFVAPRPLSPRTRRPDETLAVVNDMVPNKKSCDLLLTGHVELVPLPSGELLPRHVTVRLGECATSFVVVAGGPGRVPLSPPYVQGGVYPAGIASFDPLELDYVHELDFDYDRYLSADPRLRLEGVDTGAELSIEGLFDEAERVHVTLPAVGARALLDPARDNKPLDFELFLDTLVVDVDARVIDLVWRGFVQTEQNFRHHVDRVLVGFMSDEDYQGDEESDDVEQAFAPILRELGRARLSYAWELEDLLAGTPPPAIPEEDHELARHECLDSAPGSPPTLTLAEHATIAAELVEARRPRLDVLSQRGLTELDWVLEERSLGERLASVPEEGETLQQKYERLFTQAQDALARPDDDRFRPEDYAEITVRLEVDNPEQVFRDHALTLGSWMRIDRKWRARLGEDAALATRVGALLDAERERRGERRAPDVDDEGKIKS